MGIFSGVLLASDLDGTLINSSGAVSEGNRAALCAFMEEGGLFAPATGRSLLGFAHLRKRLPYNAPCILSNGAYIYDCLKERELYSYPLQGGHLEVLEDILTHAPKIGIELHRPMKKYILNRNAYIERHLRYVDATGYDVSQYREAPEPWIKLLLADHPDLLRETALRLIPRFGQRFAFIFSFPFMLEIQNIETDKGSAVTELARLLEIQPENVYTAGDAQNDLSMLLQFESFAPENAVPEAKSAAKHRMPHHDADMIATVIDFLREKYRNK